VGKGGGRKVLFISIIAVVLVLSVMILSHELGHFFMAKRMGVRVEAFSFGFGPKIWAVKKGDTEYRLCAVPFGGYVKMAGEEPTDSRTGAEWEFYSQPIGKRFNIIIAGAAVNYVIGMLIFCFVFAVSPVLTSQIGEVKKGYPAAEAGLKENDRVVEINGWHVRHWNDVLRVLFISADNVRMTVERNGGILAFEVQKKETEIEDVSGKFVKRKLVGIAPSGKTVKYNIPNAIAMGLRETLFLTVFTLFVVLKLFTGALSIKFVAGPIAIVAMTSQAARLGIVPLLSLTALISISLAIFNLLPLPVLDGGHILFLALEKLRGRPLDRKVQEVTQQVAMALLLALVLIVSWNDILRFFVKR